MIEQLVCQRCFTGWASKADGLWKFEIGSLCPDNLASRREWSGSRLDPVPCNGVLLPLRLWSKRRLAERDEIIAQRQRAMGQT